MNANGRSPAVRARPRPADLWGLAFTAMRQQKVRTTLTLIGVVVGTFALVMSLAVGQGVDRAIVGLFQRDDRLRKIWVYPSYQDVPQGLPADRLEPKGSMSHAKRERLRRAIARTVPGGTRRRVKLNRSNLARIAALEHVASALPTIRFLGDVQASLEGKSQFVSAVSVMPSAISLSDRLIAGRLFQPGDGKVAIVHEYLLYRWGLVSDADAASALGRKLRVELRPRPPETFNPVWILGNTGREVNEREVRALDSALKRLAALVRFLPIPADERQALRDLFDHISTTSTKRPAQPVIDEFTIVGIVREWWETDQDSRAFGENDAELDDVLLPVAAATEFALRIPDVVEDGFDGAIVTVDIDSEVKGVVDRIKEMGFQESSLIDFIAVVRLNVMMVSLATAFIAVVALAVAGIGITNTMIMSVLERMREIGIMKALGARDRHIRFLFVVEGTIIGVIGSGLGMMLSWLASFPADRIARSILEPQTPPLLRSAMAQPLLAFPYWLVLGVPVLVCVITTVAAWFPASRAAAVDPVTSLRHE